MGLRDLQLILLADGGAELITADDPDATVWASDTDEDFQEEFPELLDENDTEHLLDYLEEKGILTTRECEIVDVIAEPLGGECDDLEPGDLDDDEGDWDEDDDDWNQDDDFIEGEVVQ